MQPYGNDIVGGDSEKSGAEGAEGARFLNPEMAAWQKEMQQREEQAQANGAKNLAPPASHAVSVVSGERVTQ